MVASAALTDAQLVARCRAGDEDAWRELVDRFSRYVYAICVQAFRLSEHDADAVFQEVFSRAYQHLDKLRDDDAVRPWLAQMTRRLCVDRIRAGARESVGEIDAESAAPTETLERIEEAFAVHEAMATLPETCREILDRFFCRDESYRTIGDDLELPPGTIASRISRCLARLRDAYTGRSSIGAPS